MKKIIVIILWFILVSFDTNKPQNISVSSEGEKIIHNDVVAMIISNKVNIKSRHAYSDFCEKYQKVAIFYQIECGIPASIQLAQAITESGGGRSTLATNANNIFGMKYYKELFDGDYYLGIGGEKWRKYDSYEDSFRDHAEFLHKYYSQAIGKDWRYWANNCNGYGAKGYWKHIGMVVEKFKLWEYDKQVNEYQKKTES